MGDIAAGHCDDISNKHLQPTYYPMYNKIEAIKFQPSKPANVNDTSVKGPTVEMPLSSKKPDGWETIGRRKRCTKADIICVTAMSNSSTGLNASRSRATTFVSRLEPTADDEMLKNHIHQSCNINIQVEKRQS